MRTSYDDYKRRLETLASIKESIIKHRAVIIASFMLALVIVSVFLGINGKILDIQVGKKDLVYGENIEYVSKSIFNKNTYEYKTDNSEEWQEGLPTKPGVYEVRTVSQRSFGALEYGEAVRFTIKKKDIVIKIENNAIVYGDKLKLSADLSFEDRIVCDDYIIEDVDAHTINMLPNQETLKIVNKEGEDVTDSYNIQVSAKDVTFTRQTLRIQTQSLTKTYDGKEVEPTGYTTSSGKPAYGDQIEVIPQTFGSIAGSFANNAEVIVKNKKGEDVTNKYYSLVKTDGIVRIDPIRINIKSSSASKVYDGTALQCTEVTYDQSLLVEGESLVFDWFLSAYYVGIYDNTFGCSAGEGTNISNYQIIPEWGQLEITPAPIVIQMESASKIYDGTTLIAGYSIVSGTTYNGAYLSYYNPSMITVPGKITNMASFYPVGDYAYNYDITVLPGVLEVFKITLSVTTQSASKEYDGTALYTDDIDYSGVNTSTIPSPAPVFEKTYITKVGEVINKVSLINGTQNYYEIVDPHFGKLTVTKRIIEINVEYTELVYNGKPQEPNITWQENRLLGNDKPMTFLYAMTDVGNVGCLIDPIPIGEQLSEKAWDVKDYYEVVSAEGKNEAEFVITKRPITITLEDTTNEFLDIEYTPNVGVTNLCENHMLVNPRYDNTQKVVGSCQSRLIEFSIIETGKPVDGQRLNRNYDFDLSLVAPATVTVTKRHLQIKPRWRLVEYDRKLHSAQYFDIVDGKALAQGDYIKVSGYIGEYSEIGYHTTAIESAAVYKNNAISPNADYYELELIEGNLTISKITIYVWPAEVEEEYDGEPHSPSKVAWTEGKLLEGDYIGNCSFSGEQTELGESQSTITSDVVIYDSNNNDASEFYNINKATGIIKVIPRNIVIKTGSKKKNYDGNPLTYNQYRLEYNEKFDGVDKSVFLGTDRLEVFVIGSITKPGTAPNRAIYRLVATDSRYYNISLDPGELEILGQGDGADEQLLAVVISDNAGDIYLKSYTYAQYHGRFDQMDYSSYYFDATHNQEYLTGTGLQNAGIESHTMTVYSFIGDPLRPYYLSTDSEVKNDYELISALTEASGYSFTYYTTELGVITSLDGLLGTLSSSEQDYREYVYNNYLQIDDGKLRDYLYSVVYNQGFSKNDPAIVQKVAKYIQNSAKYNMEYDQALESEQDIVYAFLKNYKEGVCRHYAAAATMLFRVIGIPARYCEGLYGYLKSPTSPLMIENFGHAWTEVYIDGLGWINVEVTGAGDGTEPGGGSGSGGSGSDGEEPLEEETNSGILDYYSDKTIEIRPITTYKQYDGEELLPKCEVESLSGHGLFEVLISKGYTYSCTTVGNRTEVGEGTSNITNFKLYNPNGELVTKKYNIVTHPGKLVITNKPIVEIMVYKSISTYSGVKHDYLTYNCEIVQATKPAGVTSCTLNASWSITNAGIVNSTDTAKSIRLYNGNTDVTNNFYIAIKGVALQVNPKIIVINTNSATVEVTDGYIAQTMYIAQGYLAAGHRYECSFETIDPTKAGTYENKIAEFRIYDQMDNDVTGSYAIKVVEGTIEIVDVQINTPT